MAHFGSRPTTANGDATEQAWARHHAGAEPTQDGVRADRILAGFQCDSGKYFKHFWLNLVIQQSV
jgi:hypothetical protein